MGRIISILVWRILVGILFIWGGLSGESVDRITGTGGGLALIGVVLVIWGIASLSSNDPA